MNLQKFFAQPTSPKPFSTRWEFLHEDAPAFLPPSHNTVLGFGERNVLIISQVGGGPSSALGEGIEWYFPAWFIVALTALLPVFRQWKRQKDRRAADREMRMLCQTCGYDLRATPDRCPECGLVAKTGGR